MYYELLTALKILTTLKKKDLKGIVLNCIVLHTKLPSSIKIIKSSHKFKEQLKLILLNKEFCSLNEFSSG